MVVQALVQGPVQVQAPVQGVEVPVADAALVEALLVQALAPVLVPVPVLVVGVATLLLDLGQVQEF